MARRFGAALSIAASAALIVGLLVAFAAESTGDVLLYYGFGTINPLLAGVFALGVVVTFTLARRGHVSTTTSAGISLGLGLVVVGIVSVWALDGRVDVFLASGWAFPAHRWVLVGLATLVLVGAGIHAWAIGLFPGRRGPESEGRSNEYADEPRD